jgi:hypothetical protein
MRVGALSANGSSSAKTQRCSSMHVAREKTPVPPRTGRACKPIDCYIYSKSGMSLPDLPLPCWPIGLLLHLLSCSSPLPRCKYSSLLLQRIETVCKCSRRFGVQYLTLCASPLTLFFSLLPPQSEDRRACVTR